MCFDTLQCKAKNAERCFGRVSMSARKQPPKRALNSNVFKKSIRTTAKEASPPRKLDIIEKKYGPDHGLDQPEQLEAFYRRLERGGQKSLSDLIRSQ